MATSKGFGKTPKGRRSSDQQQPERDPVSRQLLAKPTPEALATARQRFQTGQLAEAEQLYRQILQRQPDQPEALHWLGVICYQTEKIDEALACWQRSIEANPNDANAHNSLGVALEEQGQLDQAEQHFRQAIALNPNHGFAHENLGKLLHGKGDWEAAANHYRRAIALQPTDAYLHVNLGSVLRELGQFDESIASLQKALTLQPTNAFAHDALGLTLMEQGNPEQAVRYLQQAVALNPNNADIHYNFALALLSVGDFPNGFAEHEWRWQTKKWRPGLFPQPLWDGSNLNGRTILLHAEQGLGDTLQFIRYVSLVRARGGRVVVACQPPLRQLLERMSGVEQVMTPSDPLLEFDVQAPLLSLPYLFKTTLNTIPAQVPYLSELARDDLDDLKVDLLPKTRFKVGLVWAGGYREKQQSARFYKQKSCPLPVMARLLSVPGCSFYSFQVGHNAADIAQLGDGHSLQDLSPQINDVADTAALIAQMDLVISVDTAVAHLGGALGKPVWVLLPVAADWRWLRQRDDSPWYPTMRLFRQQSPGDWEGVVGCIAEALHGFTSQNTPVAKKATIPSTSASPSGVDDAQAYIDMGIALLEQGELEQAAIHLQRAIALNPTDALAHLNRGIVLQAQDNLDEAILSFQMALSLNPNDGYVHAHAHRGLGGVFEAQNNLKDAAFHLRQAIALYPTQPQLYTQLGYVLQKQGKLDEALTNFCKALEIAPNDVDAHFNLSISLLSMGNLRDGFAEFEWRWHTTMLEKRSLPQPLWDGTPLDGKTILIHTEQGFGDTLQFIRYIPLVRARGGRIILTCHPPLKRLLAAVPGIEQVITPGEPLPDFTVHAPLLSLPHIFGTTLETIPASVPYLSSTIESLPPIQAFPGTQLKVGLVWASGHQAGNRQSTQLYQQKSCSFKLYVNLFATPGISFYSLQVGRNAADTSELADEYQLQDLSPLINDFADTAGFITQMDLVISVDTAVAHLAGALGKPVWVLLPFAADWRWLQQRQDSPWYPTMRLFRQSSLGDWEGVIYQVSETLRRVADGILPPIFELQSATSGAVLPLKLSQQAITFDPREVTTHVTSANALRAQGQLEDAIFAYRAALALTPEDAAIHQLLAVSLYEQGNLEEAVTHLQQAISLQERSAIAPNPTHADAHNNLGVLLREQGKLPEAVACYRRAIALNPTNAAFHTNLAIALREQGAFEDAIAHFQRAIALDANYVLAYNGLGVTYQEQDKLEEAAALFKQSIDLNPEYANPHCNLGDVYWMQGSYEQAIECYRRAIEIQPDYVEAHMYLADVLLLLGDFQNGFAENEWQLRDPERAPRLYAKPIWDGFSLENKTILLTGSGGLGDIIHFIRYAPLVKDFGGRVIVECREPLKRLLETAAGIDQVIVIDTLLPDFQVQAPITSLPYLLKTTLDTIPAQIPYLAPPDSVNLKLELFPDTHLKVGLVWASGYRDKPHLLRDHRRRSCPLPSYSRFLSIPGISFYSLQVGHNAADLAQLEGKYPIQDLSPYIHDFADTATLITQMDLIISVDTAVAHLAGALGKPIWLLLSRPHDWRWQVERQDSPWYPTMRLFRQQSPGDWEEVIEQVKAALRQVVQKTLKPVFELEPTKSSTASQHIDLQNSPDLSNAHQLDNVTPLRNRSSEITSTTLAASYNKLGLTLAEQGNFEDAAVQFCQAIAAAPDDARAYIHLGNMLREQGRLDEAIQNFQTALSLRSPDAFTAAYAHNSLGTVLLDQDKLEDASAHFRQAVALRPNNAMPHYNLGHTLLAMGQLREGFAEFEWRWQMKWTPRSFPCPLWDGSNLKNKTILLHSEGGLGDTIQFVRYIPLIKARQGRVIIHCQPPLKRLIETVAEVDQVVSDDTLPEFQVHAPFMSLPYLLQTTLETIPAQIPYLFSPANHSHKLELHSALLNPGMNCGVGAALRAAPTPQFIPQTSNTLHSDTYLKVGIVWASGYRSEDRDLLKIYRQKSCPLPIFAKLLSVPNISFYSLQVGQDAIDLTEFNEIYPLQDLSPHIHDFADTAALVSQMDLIISVDTAVAHLAGAMGKPVWTLLHFAADWRWLRGRDDSSWYPTMRLFRQPSSGDWEGVVAQVVNMLKKVVDRILEPVFDMVTAQLHEITSQDSESQLTIDSTNQTDGASGTGLIVEENPSDTSKTSDSSSHPTLGSLVETYINSGMQLAEQGNYEAAAIQLQQAIQVDQTNVLAQVHLGNMLQEQDKLEEAIYHFQAVLELNPGDSYILAYMHNSYGTALLKQKKLDEAVGHFRRATALRPNNFLPYINLGYVLCEQGKLDEAVFYLQTALNFNPRHAPIRENLGIALWKQGKLQEATVYLRQATTLAPDNINSLVLLSDVLKEQGQLDQAILCLQKALALDPNNGSHHNRMGVVLRSQGQLENAINYLHQAIVLDPSNGFAYNNLGVTLQELGRLEEAVAHLHQAIALNPNQADWHYNLARTLLKMGDLPNGFAESEWRWQTEQWCPTVFPQSLWDGSHMGDQTILLHSEQGFGDTIQFIRYAPLVKAYGGRVVVACQESLNRLLATVPGVDQVVALGQALPEFETHLPLMSLPHVLKTTLDTIPSQIPYLAVPAGHYPELQSESRLKIGLVWASGQQRENDPAFNAIHQIKSCPFSVFSEILFVPSISFYSLQIEHDATATAFFESSKLQDLSLHIQDFADTAALINQMDLVISVDTAVAHLAGALGKPVWVLLPFAADWRWLQKRQDSPWYPTVRLLQQQFPGDWNSVIQQVVYLLNQIVAGTITTVFDLESWVLADAQTQAASLTRRLTENVQLEQLSNQPLHAGEVTTTSASISHLRQAIALNSNNADAYYNLGVALSEQNELDEAISCYKKAVDLNPSHFMALTMLGATLQKQSRLDEALVHLQAALAINPESPVVQSKLGIALKGHDNLDAAIHHLRTAVNLQPDVHTILSLSDALYKTGFVEEAIHHLNTAITIEPDNADAHGGLAHGLLLMGELQDGFAEYEWRWRTNSLNQRSFAQPRWDGSNLTSKTILLYTEQGFGDTIQFIRYALVIKQLYDGRVVVFCEAALRRLLETLPDIEIMAPGAPLPEFHVHAPLLSLPHLLETKLETIPNLVPYLTPPNQHSFNLELLPNTRLKVGLVWASGYPNKNHKSRTCPLQKLKPLLCIPGISFYSLQVGRNADDISKLNDNAALQDLSPYIQDFADTAALIVQMDLVISVDTAVAHLAGALGQPVWVLLPFAADWRWLQHRQDSPWYPTMRLFRQLSPKDWESVIQDVAEALQGIASEVSEPVFTIEVTTSNAFQLRNLQLKNEGISESGYELWCGCRAPRVTHTTIHTSNQQRQNEQADECKAEIDCKTFLPNAKAITKSMTQDYELGLALKEQGKLDEATTYFSQAIALEPNNAEAYKNLGLVLYEQKKWEETISSYRKVIALQPDDVAAYTNIAKALRKLGKLDEAMLNLNQAFALDANNASAHHVLGLIFLTQGKLDEAVVQFNRAIDLDLAFAEPHYGLAYILQLNQVSLEQAAIHFRQAITLDPNFAEAHYSLACILLNQNDDELGQDNLEEAAMHLRQAIALNPSFTEAHDGCARCLLRMNHPSEAAVHFRQAIALNPNFAEAHIGLAQSLLQQGNLEEATVHFRQAIALNPNSVEAHWSLAYILLSQGDYVNGFPEYEWRWKTKEQMSELPLFSQPLWDGSNLEGKTILLWAEQGIGDVIQFIRYVPLVRAIGGRVVIGCRSLLRNLLQISFESEPIVVEGEPLPEFQVHAPLMSLPYILGTTLETIPSQTSYLIPPSDLNLKLGGCSGNSLRIGIVWASGYFQGKKKFDVYKKKSCPLSTFAKLLLIPGASFYSLQVGVNASEIAELEEEYALQDLNPLIKNFADTAALIAQMDLVISVDTAVAHLAGALGKPVWVLLPSAADWRWLLERQDTPWYPTMRLFRQQSSGDWEGVIEQVIEKLQKVIDGTADLIFHLDPRREVLAKEKNVDASSAVSESGVLSIKTSELLNLESNDQELLSLAVDSFSVIIPVYNVIQKRGENVFLRTLRSIEESIDFFCKHYSNPNKITFEIVLVDDASSDSSREVINKFVQKKPFYHIVKHSQNRGQSAARNTGIRNSKGKAIFFCDQDDLFFKNHIFNVFTSLNQPLTSDNQSLLDLCEGYPPVVKTRVQVKDRVHTFRKTEIENALVLNLAVRREVAGFVEGFPEHEVFKGRGGEDHAYNYWLSQFFSAVWLDVETVEFIRYPGNTFDLQIEKFRTAPRAYSDEDSSPSAVVRQRLMQEKAAYLWQKFQKMYPENIGKAISHLLSLAFQHYQAGQLAEAERLYRKVLQQQPNQPDALHWLGVIVYQNGKLEEGFTHLQQAVALKPDDANIQNSISVVFLEQERLEQAASHLRQAIALNPNHFFAHANLASVLIQQGDLRAATLHLQRVVALNPNHVDAYNTLGTVLHRQNRLEEAIAHYRQVISLQPHHVEALTNLGNLLRSQGNLDEAMQHLRSASTISPNFAPAHNGLGLAYMELRNWDMAVTHLQRAIDLSPGDADFHHNVALVLQKQGKLEEATSRYRQAIALNPNHVMALTSLGDVLREQEQSQEAILNLQTALALSPNHIDAHTGLGIVLQEEGDFDQALHHLQRVIDLNPNDAQAYSNLGGILWAQGKLSQAIDSYRAAIQLKPDHADAHISLGQCLLLLGDLCNGFAEYEWRWKTTDWVPRSFGKPLWDGSNLEGKTILLHFEGGFGDLLHFVRYAPLIRDRGGRVIVLCQKSLKRVMTTTLGVQQVIAEDERLPEFDVQVPCLSLPHVFRTTLETIPEQIPYLFSSNNDDFKLELLSDTRFKVGVVWASGYSERRDLLKQYRIRSCPLSMFARFLSIPEISFYSLQVGRNAADLTQRQEDYNLQDLSLHIRDFADTAALINQMDLVISVDTAVAHLAGALGKPVWMLLSKPHEWRWLLERSDTPWYPTMRLFRQPTRGDWDSVISQVITALEIMVAGGIG